MSELISDGLVNGEAPDTSVDPGNTETAETEPNLDALTEAHFTAKTTTDTDDAKGIVPDNDKDGDSDVEDEAQLQAKVDNANAEDGEGLTEEKLKELEDAAADPKTPPYLRAQIEKAVNFNRSLKAQFDEQATALEELKSAKTFEPQELERYKQAEDKVNSLSSITASPDEILATVKELNPRAFPEVQMKLVWDALSLPDGTPDLNNLQAVVDGWLGYDGTQERVEAKDLIKAAQAIADGRVNPIDFDEYLTDEQRQIAERLKRDDKANLERQRILDAEIENNESRARKVVLDSQLGEWQQNIRQIASTHLTKFNLVPMANDPPEAKEFKETLTEKLVAAVDKAEKQSPHMKEIAKAVDLLSKPNKMTSAEAEAEIKSYFSNPLVEGKLKAGLAELEKAIEQTVLREARHYKLMMKGLEAMQKEKVEGARKIPRTSGESPNAKPVSAADVEKMTASERRDMALSALSDDLRQKQKEHRAFG